MEIFKLTTEVLDESMFDDGVSEINYESEYFVSTNETVKQMREKIKKEIIRVYNEALNYCQPIEQKKKKFRQLQQKYNELRALKRKTNDSVVCAEITNKQNDIRGKKDLLRKEIDKEAKLLKNKKGTGSKLFSESEYLSLLNKVYSFYLHDMINSDERDEFVLENQDRLIASYLISSNDWNPIDSILDSDSKILID